MQTKPALMFAPMQDTAEERALQHTDKPGGYEAMFKSGLGRCVLVKWSGMISLHLGFCYCLPVGLLLRPAAVPVLR